MSSLSALHQPESFPFDRDMSGTQFVVVCYKLFPVDDITVTQAR